MKQAVKQAFLTALMLLFITSYTVGIFCAGMAVGGSLAIVHSVNSTLNNVNKTLGGAAQ